MGRKPTGNPPGRPKGVPSWARVERAREALARKADEAVALVAQAAKVAAKKGNHAGAAWMLEHMVVKNAEGKDVRPIGSGVDRQVVESGSRAPTINIGWIQPGAPVASLPVIDVRALPAHEDESS